MFFLSLFPGKEPALRSFTEIQQLIQQGKKREVKTILRENSWPINSPIRSQLWPALCAQHQTKQNMLDGFYWEMVHQVSGKLNFFFENFKKICVNYLFFYLFFIS